MDRKSSSERLAEAMARTRRHWQERAREAAEPSWMPPCPAFTIALSREAGAGGQEVAREVGAQLNWPIYDRELVELLAREMGVQRSLLESVDERRKGWLQECLEALSTAPTVSEDAYARRLARVLLALAAHGECVIVGRGAAQVLPAVTTLRVRLVAPLEARIAVIGRRLGVGQEEAARWVAATDLERSRFVRDHFRKDPGDPHLYDLVLNAARFSPAECAAFIVEALHRVQAHAPSQL